MDTRIKDFEIVRKGLAGGCTLLYLRPVDGVLPEIGVGCFAQVMVEAPGVFLRRPISVCDVVDDCILLMVKPVGNATDHLVVLPVGSRVNMIVPLGHGFTLSAANSSTLLVGGGVGIAPLVALSRALLERGVSVTVALGARSTAEIQGVEALFPDGVEVDVSTDDGSVGHHGLVTKSTVFSRSYDMIYTCGPTPMMKAVASIAAAREIPCEASLENRMACGLGACLCCVEDTQQGNVCVCTVGPVFNISKLKWS